jgi:hypothetical protein
MVSVGLALGHGMSYGMAGDVPREISPREYARDFTHIWRILPTIKYAAMGRDVSGSVTYYHDKAKLIYDNIANALRNHNDTILFIPAEMIDSLGHEGKIHYGWPSIFIENDSIIHLDEEFVQSVDMNLFTTWGPLTFSTNHKYGAVFVNAHRCIGNINEILDAVESGEDLIVTKYPERALDQLHKPKGLFRDLSIGFGIMNFNGGR